MFIVPSTSWEALEPGTPSSRASSEAAVFPFIISFFMRRYWRLSSLRTAAFVRNINSTRTSDLRVFLTNGCCHQKMMKWSWNMGNIYWSYKGMQSEKKLQNLNVCLYFFLEQKQLTLSFWGSLWDKTYHFIRPVYLSTLQCIFVSSKIRSFGAEWVENLSAKPKGAKQPSSPEGLTWRGAQSGS